MSEKFDDLLPSDAELYRRSQRWAKLFEKYQSLPDSESIDLEDIPVDENDEEVLEERESIDPSHFEDNRSSDDPSFNLKDVLNQTNKVIEKRKERWNECGIDRIMDTFCYSKITEKVGDWLKNNTEHLTPEIITNKKNFNNYVNAIEINEQKIIMEQSSDQNSLDSVDTAKYILSNRKRQKSKVTMTIKKYCYSAKNGHSAYFEDDIFSAPIRKTSYFEDDVFSDQVRKALTKNVSTAIRSKSDSFYKQKSVTPELSPAKRQKSKSRRRRPRDLSNSSSSTISERRPPPKKRTPRAQTIKISSSSEDIDDFRLKILSPKNTPAKKPTKNNLKRVPADLAINSTDSKSLSPSKKPKKQVYRTQRMKVSSISSDIDQLPLKKLSPKNTPPKKSTKNNLKRVPSDLTINSTDSKSSSPSKKRKKQVYRTQRMRVSSDSSDIDQLPLKKLSPRIYTPSNRSTKTNLQRLPSDLTINSIESISSSPSKKPKKQVHRTQQIRVSSDSSDIDQLPLKEVSPRKYTPSNRSTKTNLQRVPSDLTNNSIDLKSQESISSSKKPKKQVPRKQSINDLDFSPGDFEYFQLKKLSSSKGAPSNKSTKTNLKRVPSDLSIYDNNSIVNSTAIKSHESMINHKENLNAACEQVNVSSNLRKRNNNSQQINSQTVIISSSGVLKSTNKNRKNSKLQIIDEDLPEKVVSAKKSDNVDDQKSFNRDSNTKSKPSFSQPILFADISSDSETDILDKLKSFGEQTESVQEIFL